MKNFLFVFALLLVGLSPALAQTKVIYAEITETNPGDPSDLTLTFKAVDTDNVPAENYDATTGVGTYRLFSDVPSYTKIKSYPLSDKEICYRVKKAVFDSSVTDARPSTTNSWFLNLVNLESIEGIKNLNTSNVTDMQNMFRDCSSLTTLDVTNFNTAKVTSMRAMFYGCSGLTTLNVSNFNTAKVTSMWTMFYGCSGLTSLDLSNFDTGRVTSMSAMFFGCSGLTSLNVSKFDTKNVTDMYNMFGNCSSLKSLDVSNFNTSNVTDISFMFDGCSSLTSIDVSGFNAEKFETMAAMFVGCSSLSKLDISKWKLNLDNLGNTNKNNANFRSFARGCTNLKELDLGPNDFVYIIQYVNNRAKNNRREEEDVNVFSGTGGNDKAENLCRITFSFDKSKLTFNDSKFKNRLIIDKTNPMPPYYEFLGGYFYIAETLDCNSAEEYTPVAKTNTDLWQANRQLTTNDWNTLVVPVALTRAQLEQSFGTGVKVCRLESYSNKILHFKTVGAGESIPANEPVLVKPAEDIKNIGYANVNIEEPTNDLTKAVTSGGMSVSLIGTYKSKLTLNYDWLYYSSKDKWGAFICSDGTAFIRKTRAYVTISGAPVNSLKIAIDDDGVTNDINSIDGEVVGQPESPAYNLSGQRVGDDYKGIVIVNGKKLLRK